MNKLIGGKKCKDSYPLVDTLPNGDELLNALFPTDVFGGQVYQTLVSLSQTISEYAPSEGTGYMAKKTANVAASIVASVVTLGAGGDIAVNLVFTIMNGLVMATTLLTIIDEVIQSLNVTKQVEDENGNLIEVKALDENAVRFFYDILSIDFKDGIKGVKCWVNYIFDAYKEMGVNMIACDIFGRVYQPMAEFIGSLIASMIPNVGVVAGIFIVKLMQSNAGKNYMMGTVIKSLSRYYKKIPKKMRKILNDPEKIDEFIHKILKRNILKGYIEQPISEYSKLIAYVIHKMLALTFALLYVFKKCSVA